MATEGSGNVFLTDDVILREALRLLRNNLVAARFCNRDAESKIGAGYKIGDTVSVKKPFRVKSASGRTLVKQPMVDQSSTITVDTQRHVALSFNLVDRSLSLNEFSKRYLESAVAQIAHQVDYTILEHIVKTTFNSTGTPGTGTTHFTMIDAVASNSLLGWPQDGMAKALLNPLDSAAFRKAQISVQNDGIVKAAIERAKLGTAAGVDMFETAQMPIHTVGVGTGTPAINGTQVNGTSLVTDGWTNSTTAIVKQGDIIEIAGVYSINPQTYQSTGQLQRFVVTANANSGASTGPATLSISPSMNDGTATTTDADGNTVSLAAYQNITALPLNDALITLLGTGGTAYRQNLLIHPDAVTLAMVDINLPQSAVVAKRMRDEESGLSMTLTAAYNINDYEETYRLDVLYGVKNWYPELTRRVFGSSS